MEEVYFYEKLASTHQTTLCYNPQNFERAIYPCHFSLPLRLYPSNKGFRPVVFCVVVLPDNHSVPNNNNNNNNNNTVRSIYR